MKLPVLLLLLLLSCSLTAQRVVTFDPDKDVVASRNLDGIIRLTVPMEVLIISIQETWPAISNIQLLGIEKIGKSYYLISSGIPSAKPETGVVMAILLVETMPGAFLADELVISCSSAGDCRECSLPPLCKCNKGEGSCGQNAALYTLLKKVTVTLFD